MATDQMQNVDMNSRKEGLTEAQRLLLEKRMRGLSAKKVQNVVGSRPAGAAIPLSVEQRRIWLHASQFPDLAIYNEPITIYRHGSFDLELFERSFNEILRRHEAWRTSFSPEGEAIVHDVLRVTLPFLDLSRLPNTEREAEALRVATEDARKPLVLETVPLFHARVIRFSPQEHRLYLTLHHIIFDGLSLSKILVPELAAVYAAFEQGNVSALPEPKLQYGDYAFWSQQQLDSPLTKQHVSYWLNQLSGDLPVLRLPADRPRPAIPSHLGSMNRFWIGSDLMQELHALSRAHDTTLYVTLLAAFKVLLFRYSGQNDLIIGSPVDARRRPELDYVLGYFLDTVAIRTRPLADLSFADYLVETRDTVLDAFSAADVPFDRVVHEVKPKRDSSHDPIFQAFFSMRPILPTFPEGWALTHLDVTVGAVKFDIYLELGEQPDHIEGRFLYSTDLFDASTIDRIESHWFVLLQAICRNPETSLAYLPILTEEESALVRGSDGWNATARAIPQVPLQGLIEEQVRRTPNAIAAICGGRHFTYRQLNARSESIADALRALGVTHGSIVGIALERSLDLIAGLLGVLKLRAAYLPLDMQMPRERIGLCLTDASPAAILTQSSLLQQIAPTEFPVLLLDTIFERAEDAEALPQQAVDLSDPLDDTAYVIYTSGTTGAPKAVEISQRNVVNFLTSMQIAPGFRQDDILLAVTAISFDIAALELFLPLISGGKVVIASREEVQDPYLLTRALDQSGCTVIQATPATWRTLLLSGWNNARQSSGSMLKILCGGEPLTGELADHLLATGAELWNMYGPTETTIWSMIQRVPVETTPRTGPVSVGFPIANTQAFILDAQRQLLPLGVPGDLFLGGMGLAKGYRGQAKQTAERFFPVDTLAGERLYLTGDLAVRKANGAIEVLGRTDNQVKIRGYRVELEAVEAAVLQHSQVSAAAARVWPEATGEMRLSIYVVGNGTLPPNLADMRAFLASRLPEYMVPSDVIPLFEMPLTSNGKTDRSRLPAPVASSRPSFQAVQFSPREARLAAIWEKLLGLEQVHLDDNFFSLGGHSVLVAALQQSIALEFSQRIPMAELFHRPTVRQQAELMQRILENKPTLPPGVFALQPHGTGTPIFWVHYANEGLAKAMGQNQPFLSAVLTVEDMISLGEAPPLRSIAMFHMQKILATQPKGPYRIGGFCAGGVLAYEVASLLRAAGYEVSILILVDAPNPSPARLRKLLRYLRWIAGRGGIRAIRYSLRKRLDDRFGPPSPNRIPAKTEMRTVQDMIERAVSKYQPGRYKGNVVLIQASERLHMDLLPGWQEVISTGLQTAYVDGHHDDLMKPHNVQDVGNAILPYIV